jgi:hypothetical protein
MIKTSYFYTHLCPSWSKWEPSASDCILLLTKYFSNSFWPKLQFTSRTYGTTQAVPGFWVLKHNRFIAIVSSFLVVNFIRQRSVSQWTVFFLLALVITQRFLPKQSRRKLLRIESELLFLVRKAIRNSITILYKYFSNFVIYT